MFQIRNISDTYEYEMKGGSKMQDINLKGGVSPEFLSLDKVLDNEDENLKKAVLVKIGDKIRRIRQFQRLTQVELAKKFKCSRTYICKIERGDFFKIGISGYWNVLNKIAIALNVTISDLLEGVLETS